MSNHARERMAPAFREAAVRRRHALVASPVLDRLRQEASVWSAVVFWDEFPAAVPDARLDAELRTIRDLGFQAVRFHHLQPVYLGQGRWDLSTARRWFDAADRAGIGVIAVAEVFHRPPEDLLREHGVSREAFDQGWLDDPRHQAIVRDYAEAFVKPLRGRALAWCILGEPSPARGDSRTERPIFARWLENTYRDLDAVSSAWRVYGGQPGPASWEEAAALASPDLEGTITGVHNARTPYGARRDLARFTADREIARARALVRIVGELDPDTPIGVGSHQLFINQPKLGWDIGAWARAGHLHTTSIHLSWHFEAVGGEVDIPVYLQARQTRDYLKSGFTSAFETTGGAVQFSGGYGNHMDLGLMRRLGLAYLAAGNQTMAFWCWNHRPGGWEQGEYGMVGLSGAPRPWAHEAGRIARAMETWRHELWEEADTREVGVVESWDTDAILTCEPERHHADEGIPGRLHAGTAGLHRRALIGAGRALTLGQTDFEYVTIAEILDGLAGGYDTLLLPWHRAADPRLLDALQAYAEAGGRIVADAQFGFCDAHGRLLPRGEASPLGRLFGGWTETVHSGRTGGPAWEGDPVRGFWADLTLAGAETLATFDDGRPALIRQHHGSGEAILCALDPALEAHRPGQAWAERLLTRLCRVRHPDWSSTVPQTVRRRCARADHYFVHNPGPARTAWISADTPYAEAMDVLTAEPEPLHPSGFSVRVPAASAVWIRAVRAAG